jgi:hypothetical protein
MLLKIFKSNHPYVIFLIPLLGIALWIPSLLSLNLNTQPAPLSDATFIYQWIYNFIAPYPKLSLVLALLFLILQSYFLIRLNFKYIFIETKTYLPSVMFVLFGSILLPYQQMHPIIIGNFFLLFAIDKVFVIDKEVNQIKRYFEGGFLLGISALFYPHYYVFILLIWLSLIILRNYTWREWIAPLIGFITPLALLFAFLFLFDHHQLLINNLKETLISTSPKQVFYFWSIIPLVVIALVLLIAMLWSLLYVGVKKISTRKYFTLFFWFLALTFTAVALHPSIGFETIYIAAIPLSILYSIFFTESHRNWMLELLFILTFLSVFAIIWLH